ncbi:MAG: hypothetical protein AAGJ81_13955 [Verrucomicrobiota bacterium]
MRIIPIQALLCLLFSTVFSAEVYNDTHASKHIIDPLLGNRVEVDVLAWDFTKGLSGRKLMPCGHEIYTSSGEYSNGKLYRLVGTLTLKKQIGFRNLPGFQDPDIILQGYSNSFHYLSIEIESFTQIDSAEHAYPVLIVKKDSIDPFLPSETGQLDPEIEAYQSFEEYEVANSDSAPVVPPSAPSE